MTRVSPKVVRVTPLSGYCLRVEFDSGEVRLFDVNPYLDKGIFTQLKDEEYFRQAQVAFDAVQWPNGQDFSRDTLYLEGDPA